MNSSAAIWAAADSVVSSVAGLTPAMVRYQLRRSSTLLRNAWLVVPAMHEDTSPV